MNSLRNLATTTFLLLVAASPISSFTTFPSRESAPSTSLFSVSHDLSAEEALARTQAHLKKLQLRQNREIEDDDDLHPQQKQSIQQETLYQEYLRQSANSLKQELQKRKLNTKGRKPDLARRLAQHELKVSSTDEATENTVVVLEKGPLADDEDDAIDTGSVPYPVKYAGLPLSLAAASALHQAGFLNQPSPIQEASLSAMAKGESVLLHAPTGSGKTIAYVLPITEFLWRSQQNNLDTEDFAVIVTPTRELAAQVAGVASTLAPPGSVRLLSHPSNLMTDGSKERKDRAVNARGRPTIIVGSAKAIVHSLYGNEDLPAPPTPKPQALEFMKNVRVLVLDEVDRLLNVQGKHRVSTSKKHERPAAILTAAVARHTLGKAQIVAASATVGRPLKRELARVLGLPPPEGPRVIVAKTTIAEEESRSRPAMAREGQRPQGSSRLVTIPKNVEHYLAPVTPKGDEERTSSGQMLIKAYQVIQDTLTENGNARILLVLARGFGITTQHVIGALQHFNCYPPPKSLLDALQENAIQGTDHLVHVHRQVSGATGVGQSISSNDGSEEEGERQSPSLWVTGEDTIRGLHLDGLDVVLVVGRPRGPDEYTHIAGRTGRAGREGKVVAVISEEQAPLLRGWETMLQMEWKDYGAEK